MKQKIAGIIYYLIGFGIVLISIGIVLATCLFMLARCGHWWFGLIPYGIIAAIFLLPEILDWSDKNR